MSDQNMTRHEVVKLGGASLAAVGLSAGASGVRPVEPGPAPATDYPDFRGRIEYCYLNEGDGTRLFAEPVVENQGGRPSLLARCRHMADGPMASSARSPGTRCGVTSSLIPSKDYLARIAPYKNQKEEKAAPGARRDRPRGDAESQVG